MAKRRKFSRWRRLPGVYRFGDEKAPDPNLEPLRISLYITGVALDHATEQANRLGFDDVHEYCAEVLVKGIDAERFRGQLAEVEAKRGTLEGLHQIADDPEYLADLSAASSPRDPLTPALLPAPEWSDGGAGASPVRLDGGPFPSAADTPTTPDRPPTLALNLTLSPAALVVLRHAGQAEDEPGAFLPSLRRGDPVPPSEVAELAQALHELEIEFRDRPEMDRRLTFALHRLAFESQVLHTDAWPGGFDVWTVDMVRAVQEAVERILSGQDIRYYPDPEVPR